MESGWCSLRTTNTICLIHFVELKQETHNSSKNVAYLIISDFSQDIVQIKNSCFWKMKANCASAGLTSFFSRQVYANLSGPSQGLPYFCENFLFVNYRRFNQSCKDFPPENKVLFLRNSRELGFLCDCIIGVCSPNVLKNMFIMLLS